MAESELSALSNDAVTEIGDLEERRARALVESDFKALDEIIDDGCIHVDLRGKVQTKADLLTLLSLGRLGYDLLEIVENRISTFTNTAIVAGAYFSIMRIDGERQPAKYARHLRVYARIHDKWTVVAHQTTEAPMRL